MPPREQMTRRIQFPAPILTLSGAGPTCIIGTFSTVLGGSSAARSHAAHRCFPGANPGIWPRLSWPRQTANFQASYPSEHPLRYPALNHVNTGPQSRELQRRPEPQGPARCRRSCWCGILTSEAGASRGRRRRSAGGLKSPWVLHPT